jgi:hypothetical protein
MTQTDLHNNESDRITHVVSYPTRRRSPAFATVLSIFPGLGQIYIGYYQRGFVQVLVVAAVIALLQSHALSGAEPFFGMFLTFFWLYNIIDANRTATLYNEVMSGMGPEDLRKQLVIAGRGGSIVGGGILVLLGVLFLLHQLFDFPLDWLRNWWPVAPIAFGVHLLYKGIKDRRAGNDRSAGER